MWEPDALKLLGLPALDAAILASMYDMDLVPPARHEGTAKVLTALVAQGLCGVEDGYEVLQRLGATWLLPLPLVQHHGNFGSLYEPPSAPNSTEIRLSSAGFMAVESQLGVRPALPIGLINGDLPLILGASFGLWPERHRSHDRRPLLRLRPGFDPRGVAAGLSALMATPELPADDIAATVGPPWLEPFEVRARSFDELLLTGTQQIRLAPVKAPRGEWSHGPAQVVLDLGAPIVELLRGWLERAGQRRPTSPDLQALASGVPAP